MNVMEAMENAGSECLPTSGGVSGKGKRPNIAGWNEHVKPYAEESKFWYHVWLSAGKPTTSDLLINMKAIKMLSNVFIIMMNPEI